MGSRGFLRDFTVTETVSRCMDLTNQCQTLVSITSRAFSSSIDAAVESVHFEDFATSKIWIRVQRDAVTCRLHEFACCRRFTLASNLDPVSRASCQWLCIPATIE